MSENKEYTLADIANHTDSIVVGDSKAIVNNLSTLEKASSESLSFLSNSKYSKLVSVSKAQAIIIHDSFEITDERNYIVSSDPYLAYAKASSLFKKQIFDIDNPCIHPSASISNEIEIKFSYNYVGIPLLSQLFGQSSSPALEAKSFLFE